jgi:hypothetical protein
MGRIAGVKGWGRMTHGSTGYDLWSFVRAPLARAPLARDRAPLARAPLARDRAPLARAPLARDRVPLAHDLLAPAKRPRDGPTPRRATLAPRGTGRTRFPAAGKPAGQRSGFAGTGRRGERGANLSGSRTA